MPIFFALFYFFPIAYEMRGKSFLWAKDLSSYDMIADIQLFEDNDVLEDLKGSVKKRYKRVKTNVFKNICSITHLFFSIYN
jgi:membrane protein insertase Oxa1/YidC/SpoIIIJ